MTLEFFTFRLALQTSASPKSFLETNEFLSIPVSMFNSAIIIKLDDSKLQNLYSIEILGFGVKLKYFCIDDDEILSDIREKKWADFIGNLER